MVYSCTMLRCAKADTMSVMSPSPPAGMTVDTLKRRMKANGVKSGYALAKLIGMNPSTTSRWLRGLVPIDVRAAALIREKLPKTK